MRLFLFLTFPVFVLAMSADAAVAERLPLGASSCTSCHGGGSTEIPALDGLSAAEIESALADYRSGARAGTIMPRIAKGFSAAETRAIAAAFGRDGQAKP